MAVPESTLTTFRICGYMEDGCGDPAQGRITVTMVNPDGSLVADPTSGAQINTAAAVQNESWEDGCWCTCDLFPNSAADPAAALQPNNTSYQIVINSGGAEVINEIIHINTEDFAALPTVDQDCGPCVNISQLIDFVPTSPPPSTFKDAVADCLVDLGSSLVGPQGERGEQGLPGADGLDGAAGAAGADGDSAYDEWVAAGNVGDEAAFLASLVGPAGADGDSAYDEWLAAGNTGDEAAFLASLVGPAGADGADGVDGDSAYDEWLAAGNAGDEAAFLASLVGPAGQDGADGADGAAGADGTPDTFMTIVSNGDGTASATNADGTAGVTLCEGPCTETRVIEAGGAAPCDLTLPDGSTLTAGQPLPDGLLAIIEYDEANDTCTRQSVTALGCPEIFQNVAYTSEDASDPNTLAALEFIDVDWNGGVWSSTAVAPATDPAIGQTYTKLNAGTFGGQAYDIRATISYLGDSAGVNDWVNTSAAFGGDDLSGLRSPAGVAGSLSTSVISRSTTAGVPALSEQLMVVSIEVFEAGTTTPLVVNAYQRVADLDIGGDTTEMVSFGGQVAGYGLAPSSGVLQGATSTFVAANMVAQDGISWEGSFDDPGSTGTPASSVTAVYLGQSSWEIGVSFVRSGAGGNFTGGRLFNVSTDPEPSMVVESTSTMITIFYRSVDCEGNDVWRNEDGALVDPAPTGVINGIPSTGATATPDTVNTQDVDRISFGYDTYTDNPAGVLQHYVFKDGTITDIVHTVGTIADFVEYDILVNGASVATIGGGDVTPTALTGQTIPVVAGDIITVAPATTPAPANLPMWGNIQIRIEEAA